MYKFLTVCYCHLYPYLNCDAFCLLSTSFHNYQKNFKESFFMESSYLVFWVQSMYLSKEKKEIKTKKRYLRWLGRRTYFKLLPTLLLHKLWWERENKKQLGPNKIIAWALILRRVPFLKGVRRFILWKIVSPVLLSIYSAYSVLYIS